MSLESGDVLVSCYISSNSMQGYVLALCVRAAFPSDDSGLESGDISEGPQEVRTSSFDLPRAREGSVLGEGRD